MKWLVHPRKRECCLCHLYINHIWLLSTFTAFLHCWCRCLHSVGFVVMMMSSNRSIFRVTDHLWPVNSRTQRPMTRSLRFSLICAWINGWVSKYEAGDLRRHCAHYDATVMLQLALRYTMSFDVSNIEVYWLALRPLVNLKPILFTIELPSPSVDVDLGMNVGLDVHIDI